MSIYDPFEAYNERVTSIVLKSFTQTGQLFDVNIAIPNTRVSEYESLDKSNTSLVAAWVSASVKLQLDFYAFCNSKGAGYAPTVEEIEIVLATFNPTV